MPKKYPKILKRRYVKKGKSSFTKKVKKIAKNVVNNRLEMKRGYARYAASYISNAGTRVSNLYHMQRNITGGDEAYNEFNFNQTGASPAYFAAREGNRIHLRRIRVTFKLCWVPAPLQNIQAMATRIVIWSPAKNMDKTECETIMDTNAITQMTNGIPTSITKIQWDPTLIRVHKDKTYFVGNGLNGMPSHFTFKFFKKFNHIVKYKGVTATDVEPLDWQVYMSVFQVAGPAYTVGDPTTWNYDVKIVVAFTE